MKLDNDILECAILTKHVAGKDDRLLSAADFRVDVGRRGLPTAAGQSRMPMPSLRREPPWLETQAIPSRWRQATPLTSCDFRESTPGIEHQFLRDQIRNGIASGNAAAGSKYAFLLGG